ncbi:MAG TPA: ATP-binding cassette domain-containing protein [Gemmatimonadaceae bacterium]|nr:ATP-binding cassette domain-containing protein [Gemmatimonadaceae bacterium]
MPNPPSAISAEPTPSLELRNISKRFGNLQAVSHVSLTLRPGTVHALLGENGAGKTTLMRIAFGMISPDDGQITIAGKPLRLRSPSDAIKAGIGMVHQHFMLVPAMSVAENLELGKTGRYDARRAAERVKVIGAQTGLDLDPDSQVSSLNVAAQQRLEILRAISRDAKVLILDEPTAVLAPAESQELLKVMRRLVGNGTSIVLITHKLRDALRYSDDVSVLRRGRLVMSAPTSAVTEESLAGAMLGQESPQSASPSPSVTTPAVDAPVIQIENASIDGALSGRALTGVNLEIERGEIIGIAALDGAAADLLRVLGRRANARAGNAKLPPNAGFIPEDRHRDAMISEFRLFENVALRESGFRRGRLAWSAFRARTNSILNRFDVRAQSIEMRAGALSGGNQQKLVLGRELDDDPDVLVAENPTRGLDILATENIKQHLRAAADRGCAIIFYSSDIEEIVELANRTFVVRDGALIPVESSEEAIGYALLRS